MIVGYQAKFRQSIFQFWHGHTFLSQVVQFHNLIFPNIPFGDVWRIQKTHTTKFQGAAKHRNFKANL